MSASESRMITTVTRFNDDNNKNVLSISYIAVQLSQDLAYLRKIILYGLRQQQQEEERLAISGNESVA